MAKVFVIFAEIMINANHIPVVKFHKRKWRKVFYADIAEYFYFVISSYFMRAFSKVTKTTPLQYKKIEYLFSLFQIVLLSLYFENIRNMKTTVDSTSMYRHVISVRSDNKQTITPKERLHSVDEFVDKLEKAVKERL